jgi:hypothetical protein
MKIAAICRFALLPILLAACDSKRGAERDSVSSNAVDCLVRETQAIAPQPLDLETATFAVLARCDYPGVLERSLAAKYPGYRNYVHELMQKQYAEMILHVEVLHWSVQAPRRPPGPRKESNPRSAMPRRRLMPDDSRMAKARAGAFAIRNLEHLAHTNYSSL